MREGFEQQLKSSTYAGLPFEERFVLMLDAEILHRTNTKKERLTKVAQLRIKALPEDINLSP